MNKIFLFTVFFAFCGTLNASNDKDIVLMQEKPSESKLEQLKTFDTIINHSEKSVDTILNGKHVQIDTVLIEKIIEKTEPLVVMYEQKQYGKLIIAIMSIVFVVISIVWNRKKKKNQKINNHE